jgi:LCP family protein required for cell wall assembly
MTPRCYAQQASGAAPSRDCPGQGTDTMMLIRAGGGVFRELSIPRDSLAQIRAYPAQKINAAYAYGGAKLAIETVQGFLGIHVDHVVIVDFKGFEDFIDAIGGVTVDVPERICSQISGGAANGGFTLNLLKGQHTLNGVQALAYARTRHNSCDPAYTDINREQAQRAVIAAIKSRLTDPLRLPYNFLLGPIIGWDAPRAFVSDMGAFTMPQLVLATTVGGDSGNGLCRSANSGCNLNGPSYEIIVPASERQRSANWLLHG